MQFPCLFPSIGSLVLDLDLGLTIVLLGIEAPLVTPITISHKSRHLPETHKAILPEITLLLILYIEIHGAGHKLGNIGHFLPQLYCSSGQIKFFYCLCVVCGLKYGDSI